MTYFAAIRIATVLLNAVLFYITSVYRSARIFFAAYYNSLSWVHLALIFGSLPLTSLEQGRMFGPIKPKIFAPSTGTRMPRSLEQPSTATSSLL
ncbi:hypothetical protein RvY_16317 [Ramazzottius varieornatus]|uniref:Uncharacterized protein n=1 Tax=Ramazzottius varieornatus TaxID=947166 RepID=A0A1D1W0X3_RAMVA|nr:hypothetical protein RvY_16317 [Ramazzottius varieornatus]